MSDETPQTPEGTGDILQYAKTQSANRVKWAIQHIADHDRTILGSILVHGPAPFTNTPSTPLGGCGSLYLHGFYSQLVDERDGGARPSDMGDFGHIALGELDG